MIDLNLLTPEEQEEYIEWYKKTYPTTDKAPVKNKKKRIAELEADLARWQRMARDAELVRKQTEQELEAENARLRRAIEAAPHHLDCNIPMVARKDSESVMTVVMSDQCTIECTCWKREALGDE